MSSLSKITKLDAVAFDDLLRIQDPFGSGDGQFDLTRVQFITPGALVQLAAACYLLAEKGCDPVLRITDHRVRSYLLRARFVQVIRSITRFEPPFRNQMSQLYQETRGSDPMLIEVTKIENGAKLPDLLDKIVSVLCSRLKYRKFDAFDIATIVSEICQNTFDHNSNICGFLAMQVYSKSGNRFLEIGVADYGQGLAETLRRNPKNHPIRSDLDAIKKAIQLGTSEHDDATRGTGIYHLLEMAYKHSGAVQIRSGTANVRYRMDKRQGWAFEVPPMRGVQVVLTLPTKLAI